MAALASETTRQSAGARQAMTEGLRAQIVRRMGAFGDDDAAARRQAIGTWSAMVGAMILARTSDDAALSEEIQPETRAWITGDQDPRDAGGPEADNCSG